MSASPPARNGPLPIHLGLASAACYLIGYPLALIAGVGFGWVLVTLGGVLLMALGVVLVRRVHVGASGTEPPAPTQPEER